MDLKKIYEEQITWLHAQSKETFSVDEQVQIAHAIAKLTENYYRFVL